VLDVPAHPVRAGWRPCRYSQACDECKSCGGACRNAAGRRDAAPVRHVRSVTRRARWAAGKLLLAQELVAAAWLHDIGYAPDLVETGFHPLDGARYLHRAGITGQVVSLVAYHSCGEIEADVRGLADALVSEFKPGDPLLTDVLLYCDMTTGPGSGKSLRVVVS